MRIMMKKQGTGAPVQGYPDKYITTSDNIGLSTEHTNGIVTDQLGLEWTIDHNFSYATPTTRWNGYRNQYLDNNGLPNSFSTRRDIGNLLGAGTLYRGSANLGNGAGQGWATWYTDSTGQTPFPNVRDDIVNYIRTTPDQTFDSEYWSLGNSRDFESASIYWTPVATATEVMIEFANNHSGNSPCSLIVWNSLTEAVEYGITFGRITNQQLVNISNNGINDPYTRTMIVKHKPEFTYILSEHSTTVVGSHYLLYR